MNRESMCLRLGSKSFLWACLFMSVSLSASACASVSHTSHHHMACLGPKAVFSFSIEIKLEVYASTNPSGPQENTGKFLVAILQDTPTPLS